LDDQTDAPNPESASTPPKPSWLARAIQYFKDYLEKRRAQKNQEGASDPAVRSTAWATWSTSWATWALVAPAFGAMVVAVLQLAATKNDKRPWLSVQVEVNQFAILTRWEKSRQIFLRLKFSIKNSGQEPAINVRVYPSLVVHPGNVRREELAAPQKKTCEEGSIDSDKNPIGGIAIFPNETGTIELGSGASGFENGQPEVFSLLGCVIYSYGSGAHGQTGFRYMLGKVQDGKVWGVPFIEGPPLEPYSPEEELSKSGFPKDPPKVARIPIGELYFKPEDSGNYPK
jgi:hypothetical protein